MVHRWKLDYFSVMKHFGFIILTQSAPLILTLADTVWIISGNLEVVGCSLPSEPVETNDFDKVDVPGGGEEGGLFGTFGILSCDLVT